MQKVKLNNDVEIPILGFGVFQLTNSVLVLGRVLVESDSDLPTAYDYSKQIQLSSLSSN